MARNKPGILNRLSLWVLAAVFGLLSVAPSAQAHYLDIAQFTFYQYEEAGRLRLRVDNLPQTAVPTQAIGLPEGCEILTRQQSGPGFLPSVEFELNCARGTQGLIVTPWGRDGGRVVFNYLDGSTNSLMLSGSRSGINVQLPDWNEEIEARSLASSAWLYLVLGTEHVLIGWDHLAFVFCLAMLATGVSLVWLITAFTVGHSISLALSYLGLVNIPITPVEAVIALSVVFMAREVFFTRDSRLCLLTKDADQLHDSSAHSQRWRMAVTAMFGLIHGLGFASVLGDLGVSASDTVVALAFFNIGVELGQILFVCAVLLTLALVRRALNMELLLIRAATFSVGGLGVFWTLQRVLGI
ncbi:MAG: HupE/UreJ family protein [Pseudohongiella sp.]|nr:HupE/UreJ family protein [Pseudohongiella sp.]